MLFRFEAVSKEFAGHPLFSAVTLQANKKQRIGLVGPNGSGKTTLLELIKGRLEPDEGTIKRARELTISEIVQDPRLSSGLTVKEEALSAFQALRQLEIRLRKLESKFSVGESEIDPRLASKYESLRLHFELHGGYNYESRTEAVLFGVGFHPSETGLPCSHLSGGQVSRLFLAKALLRPADLLLLDEPTNHLDLNGIIWLIDYLKVIPCAFVIVSHDRHFLDAVTESIWELEQGTVHVYVGNYSKSRKQREERLLRQEGEYRRQREWKEKTEEFIRRNIAGQKTRQAQARRKQLAKTAWVERPLTQAQRPTFNVREAHRSGALTYEIREADVGYPEKVLLHDVDLTVHRGDRLAFLGENGSGKSTLLKTLTGNLPALRGTIRMGSRNVAGYFSQNPVLSTGAKSVYDCLRELDPGSSDQELRSYGARFLFRGDDIFKSIDHLSGGERSRLALALLLYHPANVLILDEPTNHLDIAGREALESALAAYRGTLLVVSHDLYFVNRIVEKLYLIEQERLVEIESVGQLQERLSMPVEKSRRQTRLEQPLKTNQDVAPTLSKNERQRREGKLAELEQKIASLEEEKKANLAEIEKEQDFQKLRLLGLRHQQIERQLQLLYRTWEETAQELDI